MIALLTLLCLFLSFYAYFGYPLVLFALIRLRERKGISARPKGALPQSVTIIIAARNEERVIEEKIKNTFALEAPEYLSAPLQIIVASDCSDDGTDAIVQSFASQGVELIRSPSRQGKEKAQALAVAQARGELIVFTDAKVKLEPQGLKRFCAYFEDSSVGAVSSVDRVEGSSSEGSGEGMYVRYEMWLRRLETAFDTLVGLSGSCFAVRKPLAEGMRVDIPSDFSLLIATRRAGLRGISAEDVICTYRAVRNEEEEFGRKVRTVLRGITTFFNATELLNPRRYGTFSWQLLSHKLCRWLVPWFLIVATFGAVSQAALSAFFLLVALGLLAFFLSAFLAYLYPHLREKIVFKVPLFFTVTNVAILIAWVRYWKGERAVVWQPSGKPV